MRCDTSDHASQYHLTVKDRTLKQGEKSSDPRVVVARGKKIEIRPNLADTNTYYRVAGRYQMEFPEDYSDMFSFGGPTINVTISAEHPEDIEINVSPDRDVYSRPDRWEFRRAFTRGEHVRIR
jgi:hypothetical protein